jgi:hypothetical protein
MASYSGRSLDLLITQPSGELGSLQSVALSLGGSPAIVAGVQKAMQRVSMFLLTRKGTVLGDPEYGCDFLASLTAAGTGSEAAVAAAFNRGVVEFLEYEAEWNPDAPDDEAVTSVDLVSYSLENHLLTLTVRIVTRAGAAREYLIPTQSI